MSVISDYHGAKDPDELIQKDPALWKEAVKNCKPAVDWLLDKYEEKLDLTSAQGKKEYSDVAMKLINFLSDSVERKHYEQIVAKRLDVTVEDLQQKNISTSNSPRRLKPVKNNDTQDIKDKRLKFLEDSLLAIMVFGGEAGANIDLEIPEDETKLEELSLIFETKYKNQSVDSLKKDCDDMYRQYQKARTAKRIAELSAELDKCEDDDDRVREILLEMKKLQKG